MNQLHLLLLMLQLVIYCECFRGWVGFIACNKHDIFAPHLTHQEVQWYEQK